MTEITDLQKKRAENLIWNSAQDYSFTPDFKAYDKAGIADLYWNCIIGAVRRHYDYPQIESIFRSFQTYDEDKDTYEGLLWLGLESCVFQREVSDRPVLGVLRMRYAEASVRDLAGETDYHILECLSLGHWRRALGQEPALPKYDIQLLDELEFPPDISTEEICQRAQALFQHWFHIVADEKRNTPKKWRLPGISKKEKLQQSGRYRKFGIGIADHPQNLYGGRHVGGEADDRQIKTRLTAEQLRDFMETKYGKPMFSPARSLELERKLCSGNHASTHLLFTIGERISSSQIQNGFEALSRQKEALQIEHNRAYYKKHLHRNMLAILKLSSKIQNSILLHLEPAPVKANNGTLNGSLAWRAVKFDDSRIFSKLENDNMGNLCVDILLDSSTSQKDRCETISTQGFIIAESLTRCGIPCRVSSFCSMTSYTIFRIFRDYGKPKDNGKIFEFVANGCNRDGLAIRAIHQLLSETGYEHKILIILSDCKPNDVVKIHSSGSEEFIPYERDAGLKDTALEVRRARSDGISVICIFTGDDEDVPSAKLVYGHDFVRIQSFDKLADTVGVLIQNQIKNL